MGRHATDLVADLDGEFAGRYQDQRQYPARTIEGGLFQLLQQGQRKRCGFARTGLGGT
jgi:hypothetical protein